MNFPDHDHMDKDWAKVVAVSAQNIFDGYALHVIESTTRNNAYYLWDGSALDLHQLFADVACELNVRYYRMQWYFEEMGWEVDADGSFEYEVSSVIGQRFAMLASSWYHDEVRDGKDDDVASVGYVTEHDYVQALWDLMDEVWDNFFLSGQPGGPNALGDYEAGPPLPYYCRLYGDAEWEGLLKGAAGEEAVTIDDLAECEVGHE